MSVPFDIETVDLSEEELRAQEATYGALADSVRALNEASLRTTVPADEVAQIRDELEAITQRLRKSQIPGPHGVVMTRTGEQRTYGNAVVGLRNPIAVPLEIETDPEGRAWSRFDLNALYEGPPALVHGGVTALILDQVLGQAAAAGQAPGMTGTLTLRYRRPTPLGTCSAEAWIHERQGVKTIVHGCIRDAEDNTTVEAEGIFILPRWAREMLAAHEATPDRFE